MAHTLTGTEIACGVTVEAVEKLRRRVLVIDHATRVVLPGDTPPALAASTARLALGRPATFAGKNSLGQIVYRAERTDP